MGQETWGHHMDYILSILGYSVGVGSLWKFPYMCMRNGGGAFLLLFLLFTFIGAIPCVFLEMTIGQYSQSGPVNVWNLCPPFKGVGVGTVVVTTIFSTYYPSLFAWFLYYFFHCFSTEIPWATCDNDWNTPTCIGQRMQNLTIAGINGTSDNITALDPIGLYSKWENGTSNISDTSETSLTAAEEFWRFKVLELSGGLQEIGDMRWPLAGCLALTYLMVFLCMFQGIKVSGKVVYITVAAPYIVLTIFLVRGALLPGAADGIYYFIYPQFDKLLEPKIWIEAVNYALYSLGIAWGCIITMAGHNKFSNNCYRVRDVLRDIYQHNRTPLYRLLAFGRIFWDAIIITAIDAGTAIFVGFSFFAVMGHVAHLRGVTVEAFQSSGFNLGFIVYPEAMSTLPLPQLWSALTFIMLLTLGIDSLVPTFENAVTAIADQFPRLARRKWLLYSIVLLPSFLVGLIYMTQGGMYVLTLVEWYAFFPSIALFAMLECFVVTWIYGTNRINKDIALMWGKDIPRVMTFALKYICPILLSVVFCYSLYSYRPPKYDDFIYPTWATGIGWMISFASIIPLPVIFIWTVYNTKGDTVKEKFQKAMQPDMNWGPQSHSDIPPIEARDTMM